jgi:outer membrane protein assembly factor BamB
MVFLHERIEPAMANTNRSIGAIAGCLVLFAACAFAQDWPQWRGVNRDGKISGFTAPAAWPKELAQKWKTTVGLGDATPALVGERLYVFTRQENDEVTLCLNAANGKELWQNKYTAIAVTGPPAAHPGPRSSPTVVDGKVITLGVGCILTCLDATTGKPLWRNEDYATTESPFYTSMSPIVVDGMCIAQLGKKDTGVILALDLATGNVKWKWGPGDCPGFASPVLMTVDGTKQIVTLTEQRIVGVATADGKLLWEIPFVSKGRAFNAPTPIVDGQTMIYTGATRGTKAVKIEKQGDGFTVNELWSSPIATIFNTPVLKDGLLYGLSERASLFCLNAQTGQEAWTAKDKLSPFGSVIDAGSVLIALSEKNGLIVFKPGDKQYEELARYKVSDTPIYAHPVIAGNRIFIKDKDALTLWTIE